MTPKEAKIALDELLAGVLVTLEVEVEEGDEGPVMSAWGTLGLDEQGFYLVGKSSLFNVHWPTSVRGAPGNLEFSIGAGATVVVQEQVAVEVSDDLDLGTRRIDAATPRVKHTVRKERSSVSYHPQVLIEVQGRSVEVDQRMAPLNPRVGAERLSHGVLLPGRHGGARHGTWLAGRRVGELRLRQRSGAICAPGQWAGDPHDVGAVGSSAPAMTQRRQGRSRVASSRRSSYGDAVALVEREERDED